MTQEDKELLLKDLCARLPYKVKCMAISDENESATITLTGTIVECFDKGIVSKLKPYLRPMSSMTFEEQREYLTIPLSPDNPYTMIDWLNAHHFDYRGLIEKGFALEAHEGMYK